MGKVRIVFYGALVRVTGEKEVEVDASTLKEALDKLTTKYGDAFEEKLFNEAGILKRFINIYVNGKDVRFLSNVDTELKRDDEASIIPAVSGG